MEILLWQVRQDKNMSIRALAEKSGVSKSEISDIENGVKIPRIDTLCMLAVALDVTVEDLISYVNFTIIYHFLR